MKTCDRVGCCNFLTNFILACRCDKCIIDSFTMKTEDMQKISQDYEKEIINRIELDTFIKSHIKTLNTINIPRKVCTIDIGGTTLKIALIEIFPDRNLIFLKERFITNLPRCEEKKNLFMWTASHVKDYLIDVNYSDTLSVLSFSYSIKIKEKDKAILIDNTKLGTIADVKINSDPVELMNEALNRYDINLKVSLIMNDSTATFMATYNANPNTFLGIILGTGTNGAFLDQHDEIINSEWRTFKSKNIKLTSFDKEIIRLNKNDGSYNGFTECIIGGKNFLNLVNLILKHMKLPKLETIKDIFHHKEIRTEVHDIITTVLTRNLSILAGMICGAAVYKRVTGDAVISCNGSILNDKENLDILERKVNECKSVIPELNNTNFIFKYIVDGTLVGSAFGLYYIN